jgi:hypothetical protein
VQTQVTGLNDAGVIVGFWSSLNNASQVNDNFGLVDYRGHFSNANYRPGHPPARPSTSCWAETTKTSRWASSPTRWALATVTSTTSAAKGSPGCWIPNSPDASLTAAAINDRGDVAGVHTNPATGVSDGFLLSRHGRFTDLAVPNATSTMALGVNSRDEVVGVWTDAANDTHGFTWTPWDGFQSIDEPQGQGATTINGVNDKGRLVGFYTDAAGNVDGFLAAPVRTHHDR